MKSRIFIFIILFSNFVFSQTSQEYMQSDLGEMRFFFLNKKWDKFYDFAYSGRFGSDKNKLTENAISHNLKMENDGLRILNIYYKDFHENIEYKNELQTSFTEVMLVDSPEGRIVLEDTIIGTSNDNGKHWKFLNSGKDDNKAMHKKFPNLSSNIVIKPKTRKTLDEEELKEKCRAYKNLELNYTTAIGLKKMKISISENTQKESSNDESYYYTSKIIRDSKNPCKIDGIIEEVYNKPNSKLKIGDTLHIEITGYENDNYYLISKINNNGLISSSKLTVLRKN